MRYSISTKAGVAIYITAALAFLSELIGEIFGYYLINNNWFTHEIIEIFTLIGFIVGGLLIWQNHKVLITRNAKVENHLRAAQGEFLKMINLQFDSWNLSEAERDIALLTVKGMSVSEIAELRNTSQGTIKAQNNSIYRKAGIKTRTQLLGVLIDELLIDNQSTS